MQLILETENSSVHLIEKMSAFNQDNMAEKLIQNGNILEAEFNEKLNGNSVYDREDVNSNGSSEKENRVGNSKQVSNGGDTTSTNESTAEKLKETPEKTKESPEKTKETTEKTKETTEKTKETTEKTKETTEKTKETTEKTKETTEKTKEVVPSIEDSEEIATTDKETGEPLPSSEEIKEGTSSDEFSKEEENKCLSSTDIMSETLPPAQSTDEKVLLDEKTKEAVEHPKSHGKEVNEEISCSESLENNEPKESEKSIETTPICAETMEINSNIEEIKGKVLPRPSEELKDDNVINDDAPSEIMPENYPADTCNTVADNTSNKTVLDEEPKESIMDIDKELENTCNTVADNTSNKTVLDDEPKESIMDIDKELENDNISVESGNKKNDCINVDEDDSMFENQDLEESLENVNDSLNAVVTNIVNDLDEDLDTEDVNEPKNDAETKELSSANDESLNLDENKQAESKNSTVVSAMELDADDSFECDETMKKVQSENVSAKHTIDSPSSEEISITESKVDAIDEKVASIVENNTTEVTSEEINQVDLSLETDSDTLKIRESEKNTENRIKVTDVVDRKKDVTDVVDSDSKKSDVPVDDSDDVKIIEDTHSVSETKDETASEKVENLAPVIKLSNSMDILSDDENEPPKDEKRESTKNHAPKETEKQCINLDDDDDIMLIDEDNSLNSKVENVEKTPEKIEEKLESESKVEENVVDLDAVKESEVREESASHVDQVLPNNKEDESSKPSEPAVEAAEATLKSEHPKPLIPEDFFKTYRKNLTDMTRDDLEEFCILKIVESIIDRSNLNEIRTKLKNMAQSIEEYKKKALLLTKQNRDLQVVLKSVQEEQKKRTDQPIAPLKITRSVGMQVLMTDRNRKRNIPIPTPPSTNIHQVTTTSTSNNARVTRNTTQSARGPKAAAPQQIPVPRLVPAVNNTQNKTASVTPAWANNTKSVTLNGVKIPGLINKGPEKRTHSRMQAQSQSPEIFSSPSSVTVDLTDDEPPSKVATKASPAPPVRLLYQQNVSPRLPMNQASNSPRKVFIPINAQNQVRGGQAIMLRNVGPGGPRGKVPIQPMVRVPQNTLPMRRVQSGGRHPAPLPDIIKQYEPPNWKALPPAPDLKLSKVENGIVISWKIDGYPEETYEEIASYQLYAYQETSAAPSTALWKKIGDVKALPLPMACTLTQFMAGYKYYFAVRAVDVRSRLGPFSLPGSILLLNKM